MKPTVIANANANASTGSGAGNGITIPINHEYSGPPQPTTQHYPQSQSQQYYPAPAGQHYVGVDPHATAYGSPGSHPARAQQQPQQMHPNVQQQQIPQHFQQDFDFDSDMFPRSRLGRMGHDPFADFGTSHFDFPQFNSLGRRRVNNSHNDDDFFNRLPSEFRQYIPETFGHRARNVPTAAAAAAAAASAPGMAGSPGPQAPAQMPQHYYHTMPPSPSKKVCDAAIQTEDPNAGRSEVDHAVHSDNLNQHGLRNTMDMGVKSAAENDNAAFRSHSAPPPEQQQQYHTQQQIPVNGQRPMPQQQQQPQHQGARPQFGTQTSPQVQQAGPQFQKAYYAPHQSAHPQQQQPQQKQQTPPPPQTPGGSYIRTIPIFVEGRSEPIINHKEIPNQNAAPNVHTGRAFTPPRQQPHQQQQQQQPQSHQPQHRPTPLNTQAHPPAQEQQQQQGAGLPPQTPHTVDSINKIQDIQRDVLDLMTRVEQFKGTRADKDYAYLDEMLTRNLLKLDNIDTNGKESIRLARKEAIKCIQASINVLEAKAEENKKAAEAANAPVAMATEEEAPKKSNSGAKVTKDPSQTNVEQAVVEEQLAEAKNIQEPIPLPAPEGMMAPNENTGEATAEATKQTEKEPSPAAAEKEGAACDTTESSAASATTTTETK